MSIPSVSGSEGKVGEFLESHLGSLGYRVERQNVTHDRFNVIAFAGQPHVMFCTHIDTVPPVLPIGEDNDYLYGRGACDTKGIIAAMLEAGDRLRRNGTTNFGYLFVVAEETDSSGAKAANTLKWDTKYTIVGEPTENYLARAQKGSMMANLTVKGRAAHSGYPERGISAIDNLLKVLTDVQNEDWGNDPVLGKGMVNIGFLQGGERANIVAAHATASIMIRTYSTRPGRREDAEDCRKSSYHGRGQRLRSADPARGRRLSDDGCFVWKRCTASGESRQTASGRSGFHPRCAHGRRKNQQKGIDGRR